MHCGHYFHGKLDFDYKRNLRAQCVACNRHKSGNLANYAIKLAKELGVDGLQQLKADAYSVEYTNEDLERIIEELKTLLDNLPYYG
jgi:L-ribulose-5-phosphate 3-epimerase UlaE